VDQGTAAFMVPQSLTVEHMKQVVIALFSSLITFPLLRADRLTFPFISLGRRTSQLLFMSKPASAILICAHKGPERSRLRRRTILPPR